MTGYFISMMILDYKTTLIVGAFIILSITISNTLKKLIYKSTSEYKKTFSKSKDLTLNALTKFIIEEMEYLPIIIKNMKICKMSLKRNPSNR